ncbi:Asp23/Gls24 family envelope stress response protein [Dietzia cinnamea]|uniref:Asp23/Gls24 family envelope stress response protein n=1 Tax=Dietzia cinnamea TaxID=321318 RepID=UPI00195CAB60|nr:Asp23/Gls24 family envelope stress response protein [Dietzia cinnamea]MBM7232021.1 Asp23/Gls24 family envelope stress response protein [Dietzia cinnamea]MCT2061219.1 Asp23/Gls24 family envelope stress response protein [Dietzia cinnamea]MCT2235188.1 Asp23/Gls24 family envelope stress response protein [Dietzia cinnamea]
MTAAHTDRADQRPAADPSVDGLSVSPGQSSAPAEQRGLTTIPASVVGRIAEQVASECTGVGGAAGGLLGVGARRDFDSRPSATCDLYGTVAVLRLDVGVAFPVDLKATCRSLRQHVRYRVHELTGVEVGRLDIAISWLNPAAATRGALR